MVPTLRITRRALMPVILVAGSAAFVSGCSYLPWSKKEAAENGATENESGPKVELDINGVDGALRDNISAYLGIAKEACDAAEWRVQRVFGRAKEETRNALRALGHYRPEIETSLSQGEDCWKASVQVVAGERAVVRKVDLRISGEASELESFQALREDLPLREGEPLSHADYAASKRRLESLAASNGFLDARFEMAQLRVDPEAAAADALLHFNSGPRYKLGELHIEQSTIDDDLLNRLLRYEPGRPYTAATIQNMDRALSDSGYFDMVEVRPMTRSSDDKTVDLSIRATPRKRHSYTAGIGFATDVGPRLRLGYENRRINKRGHQFGARMLFSAVKQEAEADYRIPLDDPRTDWLSFSAGLLREENDSFETVAGKVGVRRSTMVFDDWLMNTFLEYRIDDFDVGSQRGRSKLLIPGISLARTVSDDKLRPTRGWRLYGELKGSAEAILSDVSFVSLRVEGGWLRTLPWGGRILTRGELGAITVNDFRALPPSLRFFTGGDTSVRGYDFESLGPKDAGDEVIGGRYLAVASLEYEHPITANWGVATFVDTGNAFSNSFDEGFKTGVGVGLRWQSPVGPVRIDLAHPLNDDGDDTLVRLHLRLGPDL